MNKRLFLEEFIDYKGLEVFIFGVLKIMEVYF